MQPPMNGQHGPPPPQVSGAPQAPQQYYHQQQQPQYYQQGAPQPWGQPQQYAPPPQQYAPPPQQYAPPPQQYAPPPQQYPPPPQQQQQYAPPPQQQFGTTPGGDEVRSLWIGDLQYWMDENFLHYNAFGPVAQQIASVKIIRNKQSGQSEGYGFIEFYSRAAAEHTLMSFNGRMMPNGDMPFKLNWASAGTGDKRGDNGPDHTIFVGDLAADADVVQGSSHLSRRVRGVRKLVEPTKIRVGSWNVGSLTGKLRELVDTAIRRRVNILCVQETKRKGRKAKEVENSGFKLWYTGTVANRNGVGILIDKSLKDGVVDVKRRGDRIILVKIVLRDLVLNIISAYAPQVGLYEVGLNESDKSQFWEDLDSMVRAIPTTEKLFIGGDLNGHVGIANAGYELAHGGFGYGSRNQEGEDILNFAVAYNLMIANTFFRKRESHLVTFSSGLRMSQIDFVLTRREDRQACLDCKVIPGECVVSQHKLVVADFRFRIRPHRDKQAKFARTKWWNLKKEKSEVFKERVTTEGTWSEGEDANNMWTKMATCIDRATGRPKGYGFVRFGDLNEQTRAMTEMNGMTLSSRQMRIGPAANKKNMDAQQMYATNGAYQSSQGMFSENDASNTTAIC